ncbi:hypothetical protein AB0L56_06985 [Streptomyces sp. NPDC052079]|uniref:hypothetical protein n=1 Tax=Streptomyces sp. NPDC052079 TaxID=3155526 RepID=UPI00341D950D
MAATGKRTRRPAPKPPKCSDCDGTGETTEAVRVGARKGRATENRQTGLCPTCWGSGLDPNPAV